MTEDEAKKKWCPHARIKGSNRAYEVGEGGVAVLVDGRPLCIASACMAWRWIDAPVEGREGSQEAVQIGSRVHVERVPAIKAVVGDGFCGLAGAPQ